MVPDWQSCLGLPPSEGTLHLPNSGKKAVSWVWPGVHCGAREGTLVRRPRRSGLSSRPFRRSSHIGTISATALLECR